MSEQTGNPSKRRRMDDENESSSSKAEATTSSENSSKPESILTPEELKNLLDMKCNHLIIDCRAPDAFKTSKINTIGCVNPTFQDNDDGIGTQSKINVLQTLEKCAPELMIHLHPPGHYSHVVIMDAVSESSKPIRVILDAFKKWNENSSTSVSVLKGGFAGFSHQFPNMILTSTDSDPRDLQLVGAPIQNDILQHLEHDSTDLEISTVEEFLCYLRDLDEMIAILQKVTLLRAKIIALKSLEPALYAELVEEEDKLTHDIEASIPDAGRCPVCYEVFQENILQCQNGHSICSNCCHALTNCPECRVSYLVEVRNRALESMLANSLKAECVCGAKMKTTDIVSHVLSCVKKSKPGIEIKKLESELLTTRLQIDEINENLRKISIIVLETETLWYSRLAEDLDVTPMAWKKLCDYMFHKQSTINFLKKKLFSMSSSE